MIRDVLSQHGYDLKKLILESKNVQEELIKRHKKEIHEKTLKKAEEKGYQLIEIYTQKKISASEINMDVGSKNFGFLDL
jgi:hypothetical protein